MNKKEIIYLFSKTIEKDIFLPKSNLCLLYYIKKHKTKTLDKIAELLIKDKIYFSLQVVRNDAGDLKKMGLIQKIGKNKVQLTKHYDRKTIQLGNS
jgi:hypothetical protein